MLDFKVEYRDKTADVVLEDSCTAGKISGLFSTRFALFMTSPMLSMLYQFVLLLGMAELDTNLTQQ